MDNFIIKFISSQLLVYIFRCLLGFLIGYYLMIAFPDYELFWGLISIILVISPEGKDARKLTLDRVKSNFIGSIVGLFCVFINPNPTVLLVMLGIIITCVICHFFKVMNMARVAIVALLIVLLQKHVSDINLAPILRFSCVAIGCLIGLMITVLTSILIKELKTKYNLEE